MMKRILKWLFIAALAGFAGYYGMRVHPQDEPAAPREVIKVPAALYPLEKARAELSDALIQQVRNDSRGVVDVQLEKKVWKLEKRVKDEERALAIRESRKASR